MSHRFCGIKDCGMHARYDGEFCTDHLIIGLRDLLALERQVNEVLARTIDRPVAMQCFYCEGYARAAQKRVTELRNGLE